MFAIHTCCSSYLLLCSKIYQNLVNESNKSFIVAHNFMSHEIWKGLIQVILLLSKLVTELVEDDFACLPGALMGWLEGWAPVFLHVVSTFSMCQGSWTFTLQQNSWTSNSVAQSSKNKCYKRQKVKVVGLLSPGPRNRRDITSTALYQSENMRGYRVHVSVAVSKDLQPPLTCNIGINWQKGLYHEGK